MHHGARNRLRKNGTSATSPPPPPLPSPLLLLFSRFQVLVVEPEVGLAPLAPGTCREGRGERGGRKSVLGLFSSLSPSSGSEPLHSIGKVLGRTLPVEVEINPDFEGICNRCRCGATLEPSEVLPVVAPGRLFELFRGEVSARNHRVSAEFGLIQNRAKSSRVEEALRLVREEGRTACTFPPRSRRCRRGCRRRAWRRTRARQTATRALAGSTSASRRGCAARSTWAWRVQARQQQTRKERETTHFSASSG